jgi:hypothetical protein
MRHFQIELLKWYEKNPKIQEKKMNRDPEGDGKCLKYGY